MTANTFVSTYLVNDPNTAVCHYKQRNEFFIFIFVTSILQTTGIRTYFTVLFFTMASLAIFNSLRFNFQHLHSNRAFAVLFDKAAF